MGLDVNASHPARVHDVINGDDLSCHAGAVKIPLKTYCSPPPQKKCSSPFSSTAHIKGRTETLNLTDKMLCALNDGCVFSESGSLRCLAFPYRRINQRSFAQSHLGMNTMQSPRCSTQQYRRFLICHTQWTPGANIFYRLDVCFQITAKDLWRKQKGGELRLHWKKSGKRSYFSASSLYLFVSVEFGTLGTEDTAQCTETST